MQSLVASYLYLKVESAWRRGITSSNAIFSGGEIKNGPFPIRLATTNPLRDPRDFHYIAANTLNHRYAVDRIDILCGNDFENCYHQPPTPIRGSIDGCICGGDKTNIHVATPTLAVK
jgi:hypothetical protein